MCEHDVFISPLYQRKALKINYLNVIFIITGNKESDVNCHSDTIADQESVKNAETILRRTRLKLQPQSHIFVTFGFIVSFAVTNSGRHIPPVTVALRTCFMCFVLDQEPSPFQTETLFTIKLL